MGLLEKAGKISDEDKKEEKPVATVAKVEPEPVAAEPKKSKKKASKKSKKAKPKAPKAPRKKRAKSEPKIMPDGYEEAGKARGSLRVFIDFAVNFGFIIAIFVGFAILETPTTLPLIIAIILSVFNMVVMPIRFNHSMGNVISRTQFVNSRGNNANFIYHSLKNTTIASYFVFLLGVLFGI